MTRKAICEILAATVAKLLPVRQTAVDACAGWAEAARYGPPVLARCL